MIAGGHVLATHGAHALRSIDVINAASFFSWANRLMLSLGEPELPKRFR